MRWLVKVRALYKEWHPLEFRKVSVLLWLEVFIALVLVGFTVILLSVFLN